MKFSIRDLFLVTVIVALAMGWYVERRSSALLGVEMKRVSENNVSMKRFLKVHGIEVHIMDNGWLRFENKAENDKRLDRALRMLEDEMSDTLLRSELEEMKRLLRGEESNTAIK